MLKQSSDNLQNNRKLRVVFDTNIYIAAFLRPGLSEELFVRALQGAFTLIASKEILHELRLKLREKNIFQNGEEEYLILLIENKVEIVSIKETPTIITRDPQDNHILACAKTGKATLIITLDKDLLSLKKWEGISILHPRTFNWIIPPP